MKKRIRLYIFAALFTAFAVVGMWLLANAGGGERDISTLENIQGIPYPPLESRAQILEALAHADVHLQEPVIGKKLLVRLTYIPHASEELSAGIRENSFWLSYPRQVFYRAGSSTLPDDQARSALLVFPLTAALQDVDGSVDLMFFSGPQPADQLAGQKEADRTYWEVTDMRAAVQPTWPSKAEVKDFVKSVLTRERPL